MTWQEAIAITIVVAAIFAGAYLAAQRPSFWLELGTRILIQLWPLLSRVVLKRMSAEEEEEWQRAIRQGRGDEWLRERWRKKRKGMF